MAKMKRFGILTGGGDCPGLNAVLVGVVRKAISLRHKIIGVRRGWAGMLEKDTVPLDRDAVSGILHRGGTILKTSRTNPCKTKEDIGKVKKPTYFVENQLGPETAKLTVKKTVGYRKISFEPDSASVRFETLMAKNFDIFRCQLKTAADFLRAFGVALID